jgi:hypothetical protein
MKLFYTDFQILTVLNNVSIRIDNIVVCHQRISFNFQQLKIERISRKTGSGNKYEKIGLKQIQKRKEGKIARLFYNNIFL